MRKFRRVARMERKAEHFRRLEFLCLFIAGLAIAGGLLSINDIEWYRSLLIIMGGFTAGACSEFCEEHSEKLCKKAKVLQKELAADKRWKKLSKAMTAASVIM